MSEFSVIDTLTYGGRRCWPMKIIFVMESDKYQCVFDVGLGARLKRRAVLETSYTPPDPHSMNKVEQKQARAAKLFVMDLFMGLDGVVLAQERNERVVIRDLLYRGETQHEVAQVVLPHSGNFVHMGRYMEVMRAYDFDKSKSDFVYGGGLES